MSDRERLYTSVKRLGPHTPTADRSLPSQALDFAFLMECNGYFFRNNYWAFTPNAIQPFTKEFTGQRVSFFGTPPHNDKFFSGGGANYEQLAAACGQQSVTDVIRQYRKLDEDQAARIAFLFGGIVRHLVSQSKRPHTFGTSIGVENAVKYAARMTMCGNYQSGDAIASTIAMYIISGGDIKDDRGFSRDILRMAHAIEEDPTAPIETADLGLSQVARLRAFARKFRGEAYTPFPSTRKYMAAFEGFPTVGAEFHFTSDAAKGNGIWQRLALLNMSQYQRGSYIQLSKKDKDVLEIRMNPSIYPVTVANWRNMMFLLPELNHAFFWITLNRGVQPGDFSWVSPSDTILLNKLRSLGMLTYASWFDEVPPQKQEGEVDFGKIYLGQTLRVNNGAYGFTGLWSGGEGSSGQVSIYSGARGNLPELAYHLSMAIVKPGILDQAPREVLERATTLRDAIALSTRERRRAFMTIQGNIESDGRLRRAYLTGVELEDLLRP